MPLCTHFHCNTSGRAGHPVGADSAAALGAREKFLEWFSAKVRRKDEIEAAAAAKRRDEAEEVRNFNFTFCQQGIF